MEEFTLRPDRIVLSDEEKELIFNHNQLFLKRITDVSIQGSENNSIYEDYFKSFPVSRYLIHFGSVQEASQVCMSAFKFNNQNFSSILNVGDEDRHFRFYVQNYWVECLINEYFWTNICGLPDQAFTAPKILNHQRYKISPDLFRSHYLCSFDEELDIYVRSAESKKHKLSSDGIFAHFFRIECGIKFSRQEREDNKNSILNKHITLLRVINKLYQMQSTPNLSKKEKINLILNVTNVFVAFRGGFLNFKNEEEENIDISIVQEKCSNLVYGPRLSKWKSVQKSKHDYLPFWNRENILDEISTLHLKIELLQSMINNIAVDILTDCKVFELIANYEFYVEQLNQKDKLDNVTNFGNSFNEDMLGEYLTNKSKIKKVA